MPDRDPALRMTRRRALVASSVGVVTALLAACVSGSRATDTLEPIPETATPIRIPGTATPFAPIAAPTTQPTLAATPVPTSGATAAPSALPVAETFATPTGTPTTPLILFVGASMVYGLGVQRTETFPAQTMALLAPATYDAVNLGVMNGVTLAELL